MQSFPILDTKGSERLRGRCHGEAFRGRIHDTVDFYIEDLFGRLGFSEQQMTVAASKVQSLALRYSPEQYEEILGISEGSTVPVWKISLLNGRSELLNVDIPECTALYLCESSVLAQNWDWVERLEGLCVLIRHERKDGFRYLSFTEPGMVGKIGLNSAGIGVCLNILFGKHRLEGLPIHLVIGRLLNAQDFTGVHKILDSCGNGKSGNLLVGSSTEGGFAKEFCGDDTFILQPEDGFLVHTNHSLGSEVGLREDGIENSRIRLERANELIKEGESEELELARKVLLDEKNSPESIMRPYSEQPKLSNHLVGSCASLVMELGKGLIHIKKGPRPDVVYETYSLYA